MSKSALRMNQIEMILKDRHTIPMKELSDILSVSEMTIRRDLEVLTANNRLIRNIRGMLVYDASQTLESGSYDIANAKDANLTNKILIGQKAAAMVEDNDVIIIDLGSTTEHLARALSSTLNVTVICVSYNVLSPLINKSSLKIHCPGGFFHADTQMFESTESLSFLKNIRARKLFASAAGIHQNLGVTCANNYEAATKKALIEASAERILLADSSKFGQVETTWISEIENYQTVVTDIGLSQEWEQYLDAKGITILKVCTDQV